MSVSHLVANDPEILVSNIIQEVQFLRIEMKSREHKVTTYNLREIIYMVRSPNRVSVCRENRSRIDTYVPEIYSRQTYRRTYQAIFHSVLSENFWRDVPFNLTFNPPNMKKEQGRKQSKRFQGEIDYRNPDSPPSCGRSGGCSGDIIEIVNDSPPSCGRYRMPGHNKKNCNNLGPSNV
ncbi:hypothetical protein M9H77_30935 [Catharanthus roseus]|uniref:Uncharacterized protein n=1 Tax=Catharanthus roseus TaxID=4058 RepID=A0ACC0A0Z8_CATRO|nr:hypothetical protein M9H77_30935 [Catharanthus roseus]